MAGRAQPGDLLAKRYVLRTLLGKSVVRDTFLALDQRSRREVVVKVFDDALIPAERFATIARILADASLAKQSAVILPRVEIALSQSPRFLVEELIVGDDLSSVLAKGQILPWQQAVDIVRSCAEGLSILLETTRGVAHRALKPSKIRLDLAGDARVLDFGIAEFGASPDPARADGLHVVYRAPEQLLGSPDEPGSDVFTLGVILFEMLTGLHPFSGPSAFQVARRVMTLESPPRPSELAPHAMVPTAIERLLVRALARQSSERFRDVTELERELALVRRSPGIVPRALPARSPMPVREVTTSPAPSLPSIDDETTALSLPKLRQINELLQSTPPAEKQALSAQPAAESTPVPVTGPPLVGALKADIPEVPSHHSRNDMIATPPRSSMSPRPHRLPSLATEETDTPKSALHVALSSGGSIVDKTESLGAERQESPDKTEVLGQLSPGPRLLETQQTGGETEKLPRSGGPHLARAAQEPVDDVTEPLLRPAFSINASTAAPPIVPFDTERTAVELRQLSRVIHADTTMELPREKDSLPASEESPSRAIVVIQDSASQAPKVTTKPALQQPKHENSTLQLEKPAVQRWTLQRILLLINAILIVLILLGLLATRLRG